MIDLYKEGKKVEDEAQRTERKVEIGKLVNVAVVTTSVNNRRVSG